MRLITILCILFSNYLKVITIHTRPKLNQTAHKGYTVFTSRLPYDTTISDITQIIQTAQIEVYQIIT